MTARAATERRLALKVDCDTFEGTRDGLPRLLRLFDRHAIRATFFFTLGPDNSGRAILRVFTRKGFLRKMLRSNALALYGPRTALSGTLLPAPQIGRRLATLIRSVGDAGHEVGVHGWDHVRWHDRLNRMSEARIELDYGRAHDEFARIFGHRARASAAPGWHATPLSLLVQDRFDLLYASNSRGGLPFFPAAQGHVFRTLEIPTTLPTWDETFNMPRFTDESVFLEFYRDIVRSTEVHSIHTEVEATALLSLFERQIELWLADGVRFVTLEEIAAETLEERERVPAREIERITLPGRAGEVTAGGRRRPG